MSIVKDRRPSLIYQQIINNSVVALDASNYTNQYANDHHKQFASNATTITPKLSSDDHHKQFVGDADTKEPTLITYNINFVDSLLQNQKNYKQPLLVDCIAVSMNNSLQVYGIVSFLNLRPEAEYRIHQNYKLYYNDNKYNNQMVTYNFFQYVQVTSFSIPLSVRPSIQLSIVDDKYNLMYKVETSVLHPPTHRKKLGVCAYVSNYNTINEVKSWVAYYKMVGVDHVILYTAIELRNMKQALSKYIDSGFLRWYGFYWPLNRYYKSYQRSIQRAQINSCYYRHRHEFEYLLMVDVDEYLLSEYNPFNISKSIESSFTDSIDVVIVKSNMVKSSHYVSRDTSLHNGRIFNDYDCILDNKKTGRPKLIINTRSRGYYGIHDCSSCRFIHLNQKDLHIFHLKKRLPNDVKGITCGTKYSFYTSRLREVLKRFS